MGTLANIVDPDEMPQYVAFHQGLLFAKLILIFRERNTIFFEIITCDPSIYKMDLSNFMENSIGPERVNQKKLNP